MEEAVRRETREETGIEVGEVVYHSSQPWPGINFSKCIFFLIYSGLTLYLTLWMHYFKSYGLLSLSIIHLIVFCATHLHFKFITRSFDCLFPFLNTKPQKSRTFGPMTILCKFNL